MVEKVELSAARAITMVIIRTDAWTHPSERGPQGCMQGIHMPN